MKEIAKKIYRAGGLSRRVLREDGLVRFSKRAAKKVYYKKFPHKKKKIYKDILFVNGCALPHPARYRVSHQMEQLQSCGVSVDSVFYEQLNPDMLKYYRGFVFFRCPITPTVRQFISEAKYFNKACFFDVDDLVIDTKYTDQISYVQQLQGSDRQLYDDGVRRMKETLQLCDYAITTTSRLQAELANYVDTVYVNRNVVSDEMIYMSEKALRERARDDERVTIGYFSGSITHNEDAQMILPSLVRVMRKLPHVYLRVAGYLDIPEELQEFGDRIERFEFMDWRQMPVVLAGCDVALAPLVDSIFNEAKSENKWAEAALVKVVTLASNIGAFKEIVKDGVTGVLVENDSWDQALEDIIGDREKRERIAEAAYAEVNDIRTTVHSGLGVTNFITEKLARNIAFFLPSTDISGGVNVVLKHADILRRRGWDVTLVDLIDSKSLRRSLKEYGYRLEIPGYNILTFCKSKLEVRFDTLVATLWSTLDTVRRYHNAKNRLYLVQGYETDFNAPGSGKVRFDANATYHESDVRYVTISLWCKRWLQEKFGQTARYAPNGINIDLYPFHERRLGGKKIHILIEGDSKSELKNTDEAFRVVAELDPKLYEISYLSYRKEPKDWYRVDHFYNRIAPEKVGEIYAGCDILIKTSLLESFSYPPLEMMATGGYVVVIPNEGNVEYLRDRENCLFYESGNITDGVAKVKELCEDASLRRKLSKCGRETAIKYDWKNIESHIVDLYESR